MDKLSYEAAQALANYGGAVTTSCEDKNTEYVTFPDGIRLIIRGGEYAGWYVCGEVYK